MKNFVERFFENAKRLGEKTALVCNEKSMSYLELSELSDKIASRLIRSGAKKEKIYPIVLERGFSYIASMIGVLKAGAAYSPLSLEYPKDRVEYIMKDSGADFVIDEAFLEDIENEKVIEDFPSIDMGDAAIAIYTSGSTGNPKGILHDHLSFTSAIIRQLEVGATEDDIEMSVTPFNFAISTHDIHTPLWAGATIHILTQAQRGDVLFIDKYIDEHNITASVISPQLLKQLPVRESSLKLINSGGERISGIYSPYAKIKNAYGLSELLSIAMTFELDKAYDNTPIGRPLEGFKALLLDAEGRKVADGEEGELCIAGTMARGYINLPELTEKTFTENPYSEDENDKRLLHTNDICKRLPDGTIVYVNRKDWMVKVNGQRVEVGEVEVQISKIPGVKTAVVKAFTDDNSQTYLCGYYSADRVIEASGIRKELLKKFPPYMIPRFLVQIDSFPLTPNGKLDRKALKEPDVKSFRAEYAPPKSDIEKTLCEAFSRILGVEKVGIDDDFFALGGDSIKVAALQTQVKELSLSTADIYMGKTVRSIAGMAGAKEASSLRTKGSSLNAKSAGVTEYPLSDMERGLYLEQKLFPGSVSYNVNIGICISGAKKDPIKESVQEIFKSHEALHSRYGEKDGIPCRILLDEVPDISDGEELKRADFEKMIEDPGEPFDLTEGIPSRLALYPLSEGGLALHMQLHHIAFDGDSIDLFAKELVSRLRNEKLKEDEPDLYGVYVSKSESEKDSDGSSEPLGIQFYEKMFEGGVPVNEMPLKGVRPKIHPVSDTVLEKVFEDKEVAFLEKTSRRYGVTLYELLLSVSALTLSQYCGSEDVVVGVPVDTRDMQSSQMIGMFVNTIPVRIRPKRGMQLFDYLSSVSDLFRQVTRACNVPFETLVSRFRPTRDDSRNPLFDMSVNYLISPEAYHGKGDDGELSVEISSPLQRMSRDIGLVFWRKKDSIQLLMQYSSELFDKDVMNNFLEQITFALRLISSPDTQAVRDLTLLPPGQEDILKSFGRGAGFKIPEKLLHKVFENCVNEDPKKTALIASDRTMSFGELNSEANCVARFLMDMGVGRGDRIVLLLERKSFYFTAMFGTLKAGGAFIPCDPNYPKERIKSIIDDAGAFCILTTAEHILDYPSVKTVDILSIPTAPDAKNPDVQMSGDDLAYMIYTSGSTGKPKGVMLRHEGICNYLYPHPANLHMSIIKNEVNAVLSVTTVSFDMSFKETTAALCNGKTLVFANEDEVNDPRALTALFKKTGADCFNATPSRMLQLLLYPPFREAIASCKIVMSGGENYPMALLDRLRNITKARIVNTYGPTEITVSCNGADITDADRITVGRPLLNVKEFIVDSDGMLCPRGVRGELYIGGPGVAVGYCNLPDQTAESFVDYKGDRYYRSGDYAVWDKDGRVLILGRMDDQVKLRGLRIELGEIERLMEEYEGISQAVAAVRKVGGQEQLVAWYTSGADIDTASLKDSLKRKLTAYMIPAAFVRVEEIPVTSNGKTDVKALPDPKITGRSSASAKTDMQKKIFDIVARIIGNNDFGVDTELYAAGLTSLSSIALSLALSEEFSVTVQIRDFRDNDTVEKLEGFILGLNNEEEEFPIFEEYPVTRIQQGIFFETQTHPGETIYNIPTLITLDKSVDTDKLKKAIVAAVDAHPYLLTRFFVNDDGEIKQKRSGHKPFTEADIKIIKCHVVDEVRGDLAKPYDLQKDVLFRFSLILSDEGNYLFLDAHHIIVDGTAKAVLLRDISRSYEGKTLTPEKYSGYEAALLEERVRNSSHYESSKKYYTDLFSGCETDCMPIPDIEIADESGSGTVISELDGDCFKAAEDFCKENGISTNAFYTAAFGYTLAKYCAREDAVYTTVNNGRNDPRFAESVSMFVRTYPVLCHIEEKNVRDLLDEVSDQLRDSLIYDAYSFEEISRELNIRAEVLFVYQGLLSESRSDFLGAPCEQEELELSEAKAGIEFYVYPVGDKLTCYCNYRKSLYTGDFISGFINVYQQVLKEFTVRENLDDVKLLNEKTAEILDGFNNTGCSHEITDIVTCFRRQVERTPDRIAVIFKDKNYTYRQADEISEKIAAFLKKAGVGNGDAVSVLIPRSEYMPIASLGVLKAGAAYQPLDPSYPAERLEFMIKDAKATCLIADRSLLDRVPGYSGKLLCLDEIEALPDVADAEKKELIESGPKPQNGFILLYTSGSTGVPKGVALLHSNLSNFCSWYIRTFELTEKSRSSAYASYGFDCCMMDMYPPLITGAAVAVVPEEIRLDLAKVQEYFDENGVTHCFMTTQVARQFAEFYSGNTLKVLIAAGEALAPLPPQDKSFTLYNCYGPSECTILVTHFAVNRLYQARVPIGGPLDNTRFYVVDRQGRLMPPDVPGELWVSGLQVGRGYINRPEKNAEVFINNPFCDEPDYSRVYRTGDVVRWMRNGSIDFIGRSDGQVKIRGFRIELKEVEAVIRDFSGVRDATVQALDAPSGGKYLCAWFASDGKIDIDAMRSFIAERKPAYMVPEAIMQIDSIPLNQNGKVNRKALPKIQSEHKEEAKTARSADNVLEAELRQELLKITGNDNIAFDEPLTYEGLSSIGFIRLSAFLFKRFNVNIPNEKFQTLSLLGLENEILLSLMNEGSGKKAVVSSEDKERTTESKYPISAAQLGIYVECAKNPESTVYNIPAWLKFEKGISVKALEDAIGRILKAHPSLNIHFETVDDQIMAVPNEEDDFCLMVSEMADEQFLEFKKDYIFTFHLNRGPLYNFSLFQTETASWLYIDFHHLIFDGFSLNLFLEELRDVLSGGAPHGETAVYSEFVSEQNEILSTKEAEYDEYFAKLFEDLDAPTGIAPDLVKTDIQGQSAIIRTPLKQDIVDKVCHRTGASEAAVFLATLCYVTARLTSSDNVFISTISSGRGDVRYLETYGMFVNTLPIASSLIPGTVDEYIVKTGEGLKAAIAHENYPFAKVADRWDYGVELMYAYQRGLIGTPDIPGLSEMTAVSSDITKFPLFARIVDDMTGPVLEIVYDDALYSEDLVKNIGRYYDTVLMRFSQDGDAVLRKVSLLNEDERKLLKDFNTVREEKEVSEDTFFFSGMERNAALFPERTAVIATDGTYTYAEFDSITDRVANALIKRGASVGGRALVLMPRTAKALFAFFGASKAGLGYIPFDPAYPTERVNLVIEDSDAQFVITTADMLPRFEGKNAIDIEELLLETDDTKPHAALDKKNISYMIYTSGSTGRPKGVMLCHEGMAHYVADMPGKEMVNTLVNECSVYCSITTLSFDISVMEYSLALSNGITLYLANEAECNDASLLAQRMIETKTDCISGTPSRIYTLLNSQEFCDALKQYGKLVICGGEKYSEKLMVKLKELVPHPMNIYGPSEITISCNEHDLTGEDIITVGKPTPGVTEYVVDTDGNELPVGVVGEIYIGGWGVGLGYNNLDEQTNAKFISFNGERVYKSGDYGRWLRNGYLEIIGRKDNQIKLRGLRIELGEVETVLSSFPGMKVTAVKIEKINNIEHLCAWFTNENKVDIRELKEALSKTLTQYMVPTAYMQLDEMPYTPNGKLDLKNLPIPELFRAEGDTARSKAEKDFCEIFSELLGVENVLATEDFFELGGTSLLVTQVVIEAAKKGYTIVFGDVFANSTPRKLALLFEAEDKDAAAASDDVIRGYDYTKINELLKKNNLRSFLNGKSQSLGNVLLTGATGFLGTHVLHEILENTDSRVYCLVRSSRGREATSRLLSYMFFYFNKSYRDLIGDRLFVCEGDVTNRESFDQLDGAGIDTVINCAATVRHFAHDNIIEDINLGGAKNVIDFCLKNKARMVQTSTMSVIEVGYTDDQTKNFSPDERVLYFGQDLSNQYVHAKFLAERAVLEAVVDKGLKAKILRYGNLSARQSDGEFQMNFESNSAMGRLRAFAALGCASYESMNRRVEFSPIDMVAKASVMLSQTCDDCMLFHVITDQYISMANVFRQMNRKDLNVRFVEQEEFDKAFEAANNNPHKASLMTSLIAYNKGEGARERVMLSMDRTYTLQVLYHLGFFWPMISGDYIESFLSGLKGLGYFD